MPVRWAGRHPLWENAIREHRKLQLRIIVTWRIVVKITVTR
jgi:hypothetical protein